MWSLFRCLVSLAIYSYFSVRLEGEVNFPSFLRCSQASNQPLRRAGPRGNVHRSLLWIFSVSPQNKTFCLEAGAPTWGCGVWAWKGGCKGVSLVLRLSLYPLCGPTSHTSTVIAVPNSGIKWSCFPREQISGLQYCGADNFLAVSSKEEHWSSNF